MGAYRELQEPYIQGYPLAGFGVRLGAYLLDSFIWGFFFLGFAVVGVLLFVVGPAGIAAAEVLEPLGPQLGATETAIIVGLLLAVLANTLFSYLYILLFWAVAGSTPGKMLLGLRIVDVEGRTIGFGRAILRLIGYMFSAFFFSLGFLWIAFDRHSQGWHDKLASTYVINTRRRLPGYARISQPPPVEVAPAPPAPMAVQVEPRGGGGGGAMMAIGCLALALGLLLMLATVVLQLNPSLKDQLFERVTSLIETATQTGTLVTGERTAGPLEPGESERWTFRGEAGDHVAFELAAAHNNAKITLRRPNGTWVDSLVDFDELLPETGTYTVEVTTLDDAPAAYDFQFQRMEKDSSRRTAGRPSAESSYERLWADANTALAEFVAAGAKSGPEGIGSDSDSRTSMLDAALRFGEVIVNLTETTPPAKFERIHRTVLPAYVTIWEGMDALLEAADEGDYGQADLEWRRILDLIEQAGWLTSSLNPACAVEALEEALNAAWPEDLAEYTGLLESYRMQCPITEEAAGMLYESYLELGKVLAASGDRQAAEDAWTIANNLQPDRPEAKALLGK